MWKELRIFKYQLVCMWRMLNGRWYVFRDAPLEVVAAAAAMNLDHFEDEPDMQVYIKEARKELDMRLQRMEKR